jgi:hypothetical protein
MASTAPVTQLADAVLAELNAPRAVNSVPTVWAQAIRATRAPFVLTEPKDIPAGGYKVTVVAGSEVSEIETRTTDKYTFEIGIYFQVLADPATTAPVDAALALCEQVSEYWRGRQPAAFPGAPCLKREKRFLYDLRDLHEQHVATLPLILTFELHD